MDAKKIAAEKAVEYVRDGMTIGLGTGTTAYWAIQRIGVLVKDGLKIKAVSSSEHSASLAKDLNIPMIDINSISGIDLTIDGADEVDPQKNLIKGGGGALLREKILAINTKQYIIVVDESKMVKQLGKFPVPVEVTGFAAVLTLKRIEALGCKAQLRTKDGKQFVTDNGNLIADCQFQTISNPHALNSTLHAIAGVVETGLFVDFSPTIVVGYKNGNVEVIK
jgi:ribose 5-phosphate isomerase A